MGKNVVEVEVTGREASLILKYSYPFPDQTAQFESIAGKKGIYRVKIEQYYLELIIGDLSRSIREIRSAQLQEELDGICNIFELALRHR